MSARRRTNVVRGTLEGGAQRGGTGDEADQWSRIAETSVSRFEKDEQKQWDSALLWILPAPPRAGGTHQGAGRIIVAKEKLQNRIIIDELGVNVPK